MTVLSHIYEWTCPQNLCVFFSQNKTEYVLNMIVFNVQNINRFVWYMTLSGKAQNMNIFVLNMTGLSYIWLDLS